MSAGAEDYFCAVPLKMPVHNKTKDTGTHMVNEKHTAANSYAGSHIRNLKEILMPLVIYYLIHFLAIIILTALVIYVLPGLGIVSKDWIVEQEATVNGIVNGLAMLIGVLPLIPSFRQALYRHHESKHYENRHHERKTPHAPYLTVLVTIMLAFTSSMSVNILCIVLHLTENSETYNQVANSQYGVIFGIGLILYGIVSPLAEEIVFRGIIYNRIKQSYSVLTAVLLSALLFGLYHGNIVQGVYGFLMGMLIAYTYERFGHFYHALLFHAAANLSVYTVTGNRALYQAIVTPYNCVIFTILSACLLYFMFSHRETCL